ncbi:MAG: AEC family transporter [Candidatus Omnitrophica bacterium]|nr:AEC family transporter [Candidatus Omnitrophota bacterium]MDE2010391.1 AEC family transporter [Candidatus Omnitrophota bacterium]MDE2231440.1 AEC family transporter [Candidatus Omnitrophota bacterium]
MFPITFQTSAVAVAQIFAMGAMGFYLVKSGIVQESGLRLLSFLSVNVLFPLFIFYQIIAHFDPVHMSFWWQFPLINISLALTGLLISSLVTFRHRGPLKDGFLAVSSLHNGGYIPLLIALSLPLGAWGTQVYTAVILSIIGFDLCLWSLGIWLVTKDESGRMDLTRLINPPLLAMFAAMIIVLTLGGGVIPGEVLKPVKIFGDAALPIAMIVIGGNLSLSGLAKMNWVHVAPAALIKLVVLPMIALIVLSTVRLNPLVSLVAMIQSCMPSSITISIIARHHETKNQDFINRGIFVTHLLSIISIPVFLGLYGKWVH